MLKNIFKTKVVRANPTSSSLSKVNFNAEEIKLINGIYRLYYYFVDS